MHIETELPTWLPVHLLVPTLFGEGSHRPKRREMAQIVSIDDARRASIFGVFREMLLEEEEGDEMQLGPRSPEAWHFPFNATGR